jgi:sulfatase maturation enzyme AslB (radical SAM superfamily)
MTLNYDDIITLDIDISNICNLKCSLCPSILYSNKFNKHFMDISVFKKIFIKFKNLKSIHIAGAASEPTLHP